MDMKNKRSITIITAFLVITGITAWYIYRDLKSPENVYPEPTTVVGSGSGETLQPNQETSSEGSSTSFRDETKIKIPNLDKKIVINIKDISEEEKNKTALEITKIIAELKIDYDRREEWLNLGILRKNLGDYEGAKEAWEFVTFIRPNDPVAFHNLGDLYSQYLIDFKKAENYYLTAIRLAPTQPFFYVKLYEFYRYFVKNPDLAEDILEKGVKVTEDVALKKLLEQYLREI